MANRHLQRSVAMQSLFEWDFQGRHDEQIDAVIARNVKEFAPGIEDSEFVNVLVKGTLEKRPAIDALIEKCARNGRWTKLRLLIVIFFVLEFMN